MAQPQSYKPLSTADAFAENARRPIDARRLEVALPFVLPRDPASLAAWGKAVNCLTLANYYEAATEGDTGMRAVSQVVLNRVKHPAFPHSVCEVVFQGSERATGCQFTFTCDGSMGRPPAPAPLARARAVAIAALQGQVEASVGMATHYHANHVVPYWAESLDKIRTLGAHIFYVWRGSWGDRAAFKAVYAGEAGSGPTIDAAAVVVEPQDGLDERSKLTLASEADRINLLYQKKSHGSPDRSFLVADEGARSLKVDSDTKPGTLQAQPVLTISSEKVLHNDR